MKSPITTHVLDTARGTPAAGVHVRLEQESVSGCWTRVGEGTTDADGRAHSLLVEASLTEAAYRLVFDAGAYFQALGVEAFWREITIKFLVRDVRAHYHVPLLVSPFGHSTYRGT
jgi:5-hydroxyisourate hydrolase